MLNLWCIICGVALYSEGMKQSTPRCYLHKRYEFSKPHSLYKSIEFKSLQKQMLSISHMNVGAMCLIVKQHFGLLRLEKTYTIAETVKYGIKDI